MKRRTYGKYRRPHYWRIQYPQAYKALIRDNFECQRCGAVDLVTRIIVHHLDESRKRGVKSMNNNLDNLISLCMPCHSKIHNVSEKLRRIDPKEVIKLRETGLTFQIIGERYNISRQRAHQIYTKNA